MTRKKKKKQRPKTPPKKRLKAKCQAHRRQPSPKPKRIELDLSELQSIVERTKEVVLGEDDRGKLKGAVDTLAFLTAEIENKNTSLRRLRRMLFGPSTEKTSKVLGKEDDADKAKGDGEAPSTSEDKPKKKTKKKRKGHGRNGVDAYEGAERIKVPHESLKHGQRCPECLKGKLYTQQEPKHLIRVKGMAPLQATVHELERLRCNLCGEVFTAEAPDGLGNEKYDATAATMMGLLKYGCGLPFNRLERLQGSLNIPLPAATQWDVLNKAADLFEPVYVELIRQAAQGKVLYNDDTTMKILNLVMPPKPVPGKASDSRTGTFTSGIVATDDEHQIALFFTGRQHAGENLADVLAKRAEDLAPPIQMCDALAQNTAGDFEAIVAHCLAHSRRKYVDVAHNFPDECEYVLEALKAVYKNDGVARGRRMSDEERLAYHIARSKTILDDLEKWLERQFAERLVEPASGLGDAIQYMVNHWEELTLFLRVPGAPLDNNACERILKKAILHRKNSLFYRSLRGAHVGDMFMSLIHTAELCKANPFEYIVSLQERHKDVVQSPADWMPWNYAKNAPAGDVAPPR